MATAVTCTNEAISQEHVMLAQTATCVLLNECTSDTCRSPQFVTARAYCQTHVCSTLLSFIQLFNACCQLVKGTTQHAAERLIHLLRCQLSLGYQLRPKEVVGNVERQVSCAYTRKGKVTRKLRMMVKEAPAGGRKTLRECCTIALLASS